MLALFSAGGLIWGGWAWWTDRSYRNAIMEIELEMANGRFGIAARKLNTALGTRARLGRGRSAPGALRTGTRADRRLPPPRPSRGSRPVLRFRTRRSWPGCVWPTTKGSSPPPSSSSTTRPATAAMTSSHVRFLLVPIYSQLGRLDEAERLIEERWEHLNETGEGASEPAIDLVRMHIELTFKPNPVEDVRTYLDQASGMAPDDDRVWLGRANLAIRDRRPTTRPSGGSTPASGAVRRMSRSGPPGSNWASRPTGSTSCSRPSSICRPTESTPAQIHRLSAWLSARRGDVESERRELERLVAADPADLTALDRLAQLCGAKPASPLRPLSCCRKKAEIKRLRARYEKLYDRKQPIRDAEEMAHLAERLGRTFEARVFLTLAISEDPERDDLRHEL